MAQDLNENGLKNLDVIKYWKYVLKNKYPTITWVICKPLDPQILFQANMWQTYIQIGVMDEMNLFQTTYIMRESLTNENTGEFWSKVDFLYCEEDDPLRLLASACGVTCISNEREMFETVLKKEKPTSIDRVNNFEKAKTYIDLIEQS